MALAASLALTIAAAGNPAQAQAQAQAQAVATSEPIKGEVKVETDNGFTRLVFRFDEAVDAKVRQSGAILVITFKHPVAVSVDRMNAGAPDYISASRSDPDGGAVRIALARKVKVNVIPAAERLYVDLLPTEWTGPPPGLPQAVVDELASRARSAERLLRKEGLVAAKKVTPTIRVKVAKLPTFMRYIFDLPEGASVMPERAAGKLTLHFDQQIKWDLADALATMPPTVQAIDAETEFDQVAVNFKFKGEPEVRSFREDRSIVVDVALGDEPGPQVAQAVVSPVAKPSSEPSSEPSSKPSSKPATMPAIAAPETVPAGIPPLPKGEPLIRDLREATAAPDAPPAAPPVATKIAAQVEPKAEPKVEPQVGPKVQPQVEAQVEPQVEAQAEPQAERQAEPKKAAPTNVEPKAATDHAQPAMAPTHPAEPPRAATADPDSKTAMGTPPPPDPKATVMVVANQSGDTLRIGFPFAVPTPAAVFTRADMLWLIFDSAAKVDIAALVHASTQTIREAISSRGKDGEAIVRIKLARPLLASLDTDGPGWVVNIGGTNLAPTLPLTIERGQVGARQAEIIIPFEHPGKTHVLNDPDIGDRLMVVTGLGPARGFLKPQYFVELRALTSTHGVVLQPIADDITASLGADKVVVGRPGGLQLSASTVAERQRQMAESFMPLTFDNQVWAFDRKAPYEARQAELIATAAAAAPPLRRQARFDLARFYLARGMAAEAKGVLDVALEDQHGGVDVAGNIMQSLADIMLDRPKQALKQLADPQIGNQLDAPIWRAVAHSREGDWPQAYAGFKAADAAIPTLPIELQRMAMREQIRTDIEMRDFAGATRAIDELQTTDVPAELQPAIDVLAGRVDQSLGRNEAALQKYRAAAASSDRSAAAQGRLRELAMLLAAHAIPRNEAIHELETLTTVWRGDETETEGLRILAHLYTEAGRYRDAFHVMRTALLAHPNSDATRKIQDEAAATFDSLFLAGKGDALPPIEALGLFYDFRELTPIGRRGDEMIRRLADRLVSVDLLDQAAELLQHQVDKRLQGAARAKVATKLATIYLMNHKPDRALDILRRTRISTLSNELRDQRLLLEARAMSDIGRRELALEVIANIKGPEAMRLRANILWAAKHYRKAGEQIELMYGDRWKQFTPLNDLERADILRAAVGYVLSDEQIGLLRLREKYAPKFADGPDRRAFDVVSSPIGSNSAEFQTIARKVAATDTLDAFLRDLKTRYPDEGTAPAGDGTTPAATPGTAPSKAPAGQAAPKVSSNSDRPKAPQEASNETADAPQAPKVPAGAPLKPDRMPTGSIGKRPSSSSPH